jgi:hypothetical protein
MTFATLAAAAPAPVASGGLAACHPARLYAAAAVGFLGLVPPTAFALLVDDRLWLGTPIWMKPLKFELSLAVFFATLALFARWLPAAVVHARWHGVYAGSVVVATVAEMAWILGAAALGTGSHFNQSTPLAATLFNLAGVLAIWFTASTALYGVLIWRSADGPRSPAVRLGVAAGLVLTFVLTVVFAATMARNGSHFVPASAPNAGGVWVMGWSRTAGDLRVAHFFGTHAMQAVPAAALLAAALLKPRPATVATAGFVVAYVAVCVAIFVQGLAGQPFLPGGA